MSFKCLLSAGAMILTMPFMAQNALSASCPQTPLAPFVKALSVDSKYDPSDITRSTVGAVDKLSVATRDYLGEYAASIVLFADQYDLRVGTPAGKVALDCMSVWLDKWAMADAMLNESATPTGQAVRVWTIASIASAVLKAQKKSPGVLKLSAQTLSWLQRLGQRVVADYEPRFTSKGSRMNNHDYWGAWAVASVAAVTGSQTDVSYAYRVFDDALQNAAWDGRTATFYLPNETARGNLGLHYTQFAMTPLVMLAEYLPSLGYTVHHQQSQIMDSLVTSALEAYLDKASYRHLYRTNQKQPSADNLTWARVYHSNHPEHASATTMMTRYGRYLTKNSRIGGDLTRLYP